MLAYTLGITKAQFVNEIKAHQVADNFIKGSYSEGEKGCAVGCSIKSINKLSKKKLSASVHKHYENYLGIPEWLALVEDAIFEGVSLTRSKAWPLEFSEAINQGADLNRVKLPFITSILEQNLITLNSLNVEDKNTKKVIEGSRKAVEQMITAQGSQNQDEIAAAESAARSAARSAESAVWSAESAAESAAELAESARLAAWSAVWSAESVAESAARSAESARLAAWSARLAAWSVAESAARSAAWSAESAAELAESAAFEKYADNLVEHLRRCK